LLLDTGDIVSGVDPFFDEAASGTETPRYLDGAEERHSGENIVGVGVVLPDFNDVSGLTLWARLGILHAAPRQRGVRSAV
jgi:hypothetical protein